MQKIENDDDFLVQGRSWVIIIIMQKIENGSKMEESVASPPLKIINSKKTEEKWKNSRGDFRTRPAPQWKNSRGDFRTRPAPLDPVPMQTLGPCTYAENRKWKENGRIRCVAASKNHQLEENGRKMEEFAGRL